MPERRVVEDDFDRIAAFAPPRDELSVHERWVIGATPTRCRRVLDVGCGWGALSRALASEGRTVLGLDISSGMVAAARRRSPDQDNVRFAQHDVMTWAPERRFDCIVSVAALHHLPLAAACRRLASFLEPGGTLLVVDLVDGWSASELPFSVASRVWRLLRRQPSRPLDPRRRAAWRTHEAHDELQSLRRVRRAYAEALPGAIVERCIDWRYHARWTKP